MTNSADTTNGVLGYEVWVITASTDAPVPPDAANSKSAAGTLWTSLGLGSERELICRVQHTKAMQPGHAGPMYLRAQEPTRVAHLTNNLRTCYTINDDFSRISKQVIQVMCRWHNKCRNVSTVLD